MDHVVQSELIAFFTKVNRTLHSRVLGHLLDGCSACLAEARRVLTCLGVPLSDAVDGDFSLIFWEAALLKDEISKAAVTWARIADMEESARLQAVQSKRGLRKYGLATYVLDEAETFAARRRYGRAIELIRFSCELVPWLSTRIYGQGSLVNLQLRQEVVLCQVKLELDVVEALDAIGRAERLKGLGVCLSERARFYRVKANVLFEVGDLEAAATAARQSALIYKEMRDRRSEAKALLQVASILRLLDPQTALPTADEGLKLLSEPEPKALLSGIFSKCDCLIKLGRVAEAESLLSSSREQIRQLADEGDDLWFRYIDALLLKKKGLHQDADAVLSHTALRFQEAGLYQAMLFQHLERIRIKAEAGKWRAAVNIAARLTPELARLGLRNDLLGMWAALQDSLTEQRNLVSQVEDQLRRRWKVPRTVRGWS